MFSINLEDWQVTAFEKSQLSKLRFPYGYLKTIPEVGNRISFRCEKNQSIQSAMVLNVYRETFAQSGKDEESIEGEGIDFFPEGKSYYGAWNIRFPNYQYKDDLETLVIIFNKTMVM